METELLDKLNSLKEPKTDVIQKALEMYLRSLESVNTECNTDVNTTNKVDQSKTSVQVVENYEILRHYKEEIDWLRDRIEYFEHTQGHILAKVAKPDGKAKKETSISLYRM